MSFSCLDYSNVGYVPGTAVTIDRNTTPEQAAATNTKPKAIVKPIPEKTDLPNRNQPVKVKDLMEYVEVNKAGGPDHGLKKDFEVILMDCEHEFYV